MSRTLIRISWPALIVIALILTTLAFVSAKPKIATPNEKGRAIGRASFSPEPQSPGSQQIASAKPLAHVETAQTTLSRWGFQPSSLSVKAGTVLLMVNNRSGFGSMTWNLSVERGQSLRSVTIPSEELDWIEELQLPVGTYTLTEANHPNWICRLTVVAQ
jgi:hypothetical protein